MVHRTGTAVKVCDRAQCMEQSSRCRTNLMLKVSCEVSSPASGERRRLPLACGPSPSDQSECESRSPPLAASPTLPPAAQLQV
jgi:hypothetical protein